METRTLKRSSANSDVKTEVNAISDYLKPNMPLPQYLPYARFLLDADLSHTAKLLYTLLLELLRLQNVRTAYALVTLPNTKSKALHRHFGFKLCGVWHSSGFKNGRWYDMGSFEKQLLPYDSSPAPLRPLSDLPQEDVQALLERACAAHILPKNSRI